MKRTVVNVISFVAVFLITMYMLFIILSFNGISNVPFNYEFWLIIKSYCFIILLINMQFFKNIFHKDRILAIFIFLVLLILVNNIYIEKSFIKFNDLECAIKYNKSRIKNAGYFVMDDYVIFKNKDSHQIAYIKINDSYFSDLYVNEIKINNYSEKDGIKFYTYSVNSDMNFYIVELKEYSNDVVISSNEHLVEYFNYRNKCYEKNVVGLYVQKNSNTIIYVGDDEYNLN